MAKGSEQFAWKLFPGVPRVCWECEEPLRTREDVAEHRTRYPGGKQEFRCRSCSETAVREKVMQTRRSLGFPT